MSSNPNTVALNYITQKLTFYSPVIIITIGTIGCICNFITFSSIKLRKNTCALYFLCAAIFDLFTLDFGMLTRLLADYFGITLYQQSRVYCKIRQFLVNVMPAIATCFIVLAAMDRYMSTSSRVAYRSFATIRCVKRIIPFSLLVCSLTYAHYIIFFDLRPTCVVLPGAYALFTVIFSIIWTTLIPNVLMLGFGFGTQWNIRVMRHRIIPVTTHQRRLQRTETQLIKMMLFQVGTSSFLLFTRTAYFSYNVFTTGTSKSDYQTALETLFATLTTQTFYINYAKSFYLYTLLSKNFRRIFIERITKIYSSIFLCQPIHVNEVPQNVVRTTHNRLQTTPMPRSLKTQ